MPGQTVVIVGGAIVGTVSAWFLRHLGHDGPVIVLEKDPTYRYASTTLSTSGIRTQFGCDINVRMSLFGAEFMKAAKQHFGPDADVGLRENGYLLLAPKGSQAARLETVRMQTEAGASIAVLTLEETRARFPWLNVADLEMATLGTANEGWFDAWTLLQTVRTGARALGVEYRHAEAVGFETEGGRIAAVRTAAGERIAADWVVNAAGPAAGRVASWVDVALPITPRKRTAFRFSGPLDGAMMPLLFDTSGLWMRPESGRFIGGITRPGDDPPAWDDFEPDHALFEHHVWPALAHRVPALEQLRLEGAWAGHYEVNALDHNGVIGFPGAPENFVIAAGFSGHGVMHAPATGRGVAELILHGGFRALDLSPLGYDRVREGRPMVETVVY